MKNKLNPILTFDKKSPTATSLGSPSARDFPPHRLSPDSRLPPPAGPTSLPLRTSILEEPERFTQTPSNSAVSPHPGPYSVSSRDPRSPGGNSDDYSLRRRLSRTNSTSQPDDSAASPRGYYDDGREDVEIPETSSLRRLRIDDASREYYVAGLKRRASSPPGDDQILHSMGSQGDLRRRDLSRGSPTPRLAAMPKGSGSSASSNGRSGSFTSTFSVGAPPGAAGVGSYGRRSPIGRSPSGASSVGAEQNANAPYAIISPSPRGSMSRAPHQRTISESRPVAPPRKVGEATKANGQRMPGFILMCECCPKKPKKFETMEELAYVLYHCCRQRAESPTNMSLARTRQRSSMSARSAATALRTRTRRSATKTAYMCDGTAGAARRSRTTARLSTRAPAGRARRTPADTAGATSLAPGRRGRAGSVARRRTRTGTSGPST